MQRFYELKNKNRQNYDPELDLIIEQYQGDDEVELPDSSREDVVKQIWISEQRSKLLLQEVYGTESDTQNVFSSLFFDQDSPTKRYATQGHSQIDEENVWAELNRQDDDLITDPRCHISRGLSHTRLAFYLDHARSEANLEDKGINKIKV
jgi:hypothetical protein